MYRHGEYGEYVNEQKYKLSTSLTGNELIYSTVPCCKKNTIH